MSIENFLPLIAISPILIGMIARSLRRNREIRREAKAMMDER